VAIPTSQKLRIPRSNPILIVFFTAHAQKNTAIKKTIRENSLMGGTLTKRSQIEASNIATVNASSGDRSVPTEQTAKQHDNEESCKPVTSKRRQYNI
jgi:hypothetical protein